MQKEDGILSEVGQRHLIRLCEEDQIDVLAKGLTPAARWFIFQRTWRRLLWKVPVLLFYLAMVFVPVVSAILWIFRRLT